MTTALALPDYPAFLAALKDRILHARISAARAVNNELILLYWDIGRGIVEKQLTAGWGDSVVERLATDLRASFPNLRGFSPRNIWDMRRFYTACTDSLFLARAAGELARDPKTPILRQAVAESDTASPIGHGGFLKPSFPESDDPKTTEKFAAQPSQPDVIKFLRQLVAEIPWGQHLLILNKLADPAARVYYLRATARLGWSRGVLLNQIKASSTIAFSKRLWLST